MRGIPIGIMSPEVGQRVVALSVPHWNENPNLSLPQEVVVTRRSDERNPFAVFVLTSGQTESLYFDHWTPAPDDDRVGRRVRFPDTPGVTREARGQVGWVVGVDGRYLIIMPEEESARRRGGRIDVVPAGAWRHSGAITYIDDSGNPVPNPRVLSEEPSEMTAAEVLGDLIGKDVIIRSLQGDSRSQEAVGAWAKVTGVYGDPNNHQVFAVPYNPSLSGVYADGAWVIDTWEVLYADQDEAPRVVDDRATEAIATIGAELMRQAEERGWCTEYDEVISALNERLPEEYRLPRRERRQAATFTVTETITRHVTLGGMAHSAEEFRERVAGITNLADLRDMYLAPGGTEQEWNNLARSQVTVTLG